MRQIVQVHTIQQWFQLDPTIRPVILASLKLKDRLLKFIEKKSQTRHLMTEVFKVPCRKCDGTGTLEIEPRYAGIHPSQIARPCLLQIYYDMMGMPKKEKLDNTKQLIFDLGHAIHDMFQGYGEAGAWGPNYTREVPLNGNTHALAEKLMLEGHADADNLFILEDIPNAPIFEVGVVHEYKSINSNGFKSLRAPKPEHKQQALIYSGVLDRPITNYFYLNKDTSQLSDYPIAFDPPLWQKLEGKLFYLKQCYESETPPPGEFGYHCDDCPFNHMCPVYKERKNKRSA